MFYRILLLIFLFIALTNLAIAADQSNATVVIEVEPTATRSIRGNTELDRHRYFAICHSGTGFDRSVQNDERYNFLARELNIHFGRTLGPINSAIRYHKAVREDPARPGYIDLDFLREKLTKNLKPDSKKLRKDFGKNLNVVAHGQPNAFPGFMGKFVSRDAGKGHAKGEGEPEFLPENVEAAAELSAAVFKYNYDNFSRPRAYEPLNEPHWSYTGDQKFADWHLATRKKMHEEVPGVAVGGPCLSVAYFYSREYLGFKGLGEFIDNTNAELDFYSFHVYDYLRWDGEDFNGGRVTSGPPLEGVLDLVPNYTVNKYKREVPIVISETGGYASELDGMDANEFAKKLLAKTTPGEGFEWEMKARSILGFNQISANIANALTFMDHPHTVKKAVPFILLNAFGWDPRYNSVLYVPENFENKKVWVPTEMLKFYELFRDLKGRRVKALSPDPDVQARAFVSGSQLFVIANNLWTKPEVLKIDAAQPESIVVRRLGRNADFTPYLKEETADSLDAIQLAGREAVVIIADYGDKIPQQRLLIEAPLYGNKVMQKVEKAAKFRIDGVPETGVDHAILRVGFSRPAKAGREVDIKVNGKLTPAEIEDCAARLEEEKHGYATTRFVRIEPSELKKSNEISVSFPDGGPGTVGTVVMRVAVERQAPKR